MNGRHSKKFHANRIAAAVAATLGVGAPMAADASTYAFSFTGIFTMLDANGGFIANTDPNPCFSASQDTDAVPNNYSGACNRTGILTGTIKYNDGPGVVSGFKCAGGSDLTPNTGCMEIAPFSFFARGKASATKVSFTQIGDGSGGPGSLILGNMGFNWNGNNGIPVSTVWNASGFLGSSCISKTGGLGLGESCSKTGAAPAGANGDGAYDGGALFATTTFNTTDIFGNNTTLGNNPSGTLPLVADAKSVGSSPMRAGPFLGANANFDFLSVNVIEKDGQLLAGAPLVSIKVPAPGATDVVHTANVQVTFDRPVTISSVSAPGGFTLRDSDGNVVPGTLTPTGSGSALQFTFNPDDINAHPDFNGLNFLETYTVTLDASIQNANSAATLGSDVSWAFTVEKRPEAQVCTGTTAVYVPQGADSNFTMLDAGGRVERGTNDVSYNLDFNDLNTAVTGTNSVKGVLTNEIASPTPYVGNLWDAHHIRLFGGPGTYSVNVDCTTTQLEMGTCAPSAFASRNITFTVGANQVGAHMLFDWNNNLNIDVVNVWDKNAKFDVKPDGRVNDLYVGATYVGPAGNEADPQGIWLYASTDVEGDGIRGRKMVGASDGFPKDSPFSGFNANFNLGPQSTCTPAPPPVTTAPENSLSKGFFGCSLNAGKVSPWQRADLGVLAGFLAALAFWRRRNRTIG